MNSTELIYKDGDRVEALVASHITFYLTQFEEALPGYVQAYEYVREHIEPHIEWYRTERMRRSAKATKEKLDAFSHWFEDGTPRMEYGLYLSSGTDAEAVGPWGFYFWLVPAELPELCGIFHIMLPAEVMHDHRNDFLTLVRDVADSMPWRSGHAGYGVQYDEGYVRDDRDAQIYAWCRRYLGVDCRDLACAVEQMADYVKSVNWLTLLDYDFVDQLGGVDAIRERLGDEIMVEERVHGVLIQAGSEPILGDVNRGDDVSLYKEVNDVIRPLRTPEHLPFPGFTEDETEEWLARFDET